MDGQSVLEIVDGRSICTGDVSRPGVQEIFRGSGGCRARRWPHPPGFSHLSQIEWLQKMLVKAKYCFLKVVCRAEFKILYPVPCRTHSAPDAAEHAAGLIRQVLLLSSLLLSSLGLSDTKAYEP